MLKSCVLVAISWAALVSLELSALFVPLCFGKFMWYALQIPLWLHHDPIIYVTGCVQLFFVYVVYQEICSREVMSRITSSLRGMPREYFLKSNFGTHFVVCLTYLSSIFIVALSYPQLLVFGCSSEYCEVFGHIGALIPFLPIICPQYPLRLRSDSPVAVCMHPRLVGGVFR